MATPASNQEAGVVTRESIQERLESAETLEEREDTIDAAVEMGMKLDEMERYLDWLEGSADGAGPDLTL